MPAYEPVVGALLMGMEVKREVTAEVYENLTHALEEAEVQYGVRFRAE